MPQDSRRSIGYRSFVTCNDPKGVVECGTIRKSKTSSHKMEHKYVSETRTRNSNESRPEKGLVVFKKSSEEFHHGPQSFQVLEVSKGAQKLNNVIEKWSNGLSSDNQSKDIAKDLLKGALDLQESLMVLGKLQAASKYVARLKQKQECYQIGGQEEGEIKQKKSGLVEEHQCTVRRKQKVLADDSSRGDFEELKKVIRESFIRQNLLPNEPKSTRRKDDYYNHHKFDSVADVPSTSSSQSSNYFDSIDDNSSCLSTAPQKASKAPNVIAKLMGLDIPSRSFQSSPQNKFEHERAVFRIDMPVTEKLQRGIDQKDDKERKTLKDILDTLQIKGLLKSNSCRKLNPYDYLDESRGEVKSYDYVPPIVVVKPLHSPWPDMKKSLGHVDSGSNTDKMLGKQKSDQSVGRSSDKFGTTENVKKMAVTKSSQGERSKSRKEEDGKVEKEKAKERVPNQIKTQVSATNQPLNKETSHKKAHEVQKAVKAGTRSTDKGCSKSKSVLQSNQAKTTSTRPGTHDNQSTAEKREVSPKRGNSKGVSNSRTQGSSHNISDKKIIKGKKHKPVDCSGGHVASRLMTENAARKDGERKIAVKCEHDLTTPDVNCKPVDKHPMGENFVSSHPEDCTNIGPVSLDLVTPPMPKDGLNATAVNPHDNTSHNEVAGSENGVDGTIATPDDDDDTSEVTDQSYKTGHGTRALLLRSQSFLTHAEELFDIVLSTQAVCQNPKKNHPESVNERLYLDYARELMDCKSVNPTELAYPLALNITWKYRGACISLEKLIQEICDGIEDLSCYCNLAGDKLPVDGIYALMKKDLFGKGLVNAMWDSGWRNGFSSYDAEQVANDIEKTLLNWLIEESFLEFAW